jgi:hypothetical protein
MDWRHFLFPVLSLATTAALAYGQKISGLSFVLGLAVISIGHYAPDVILRLRRETREPPHSAEALPVWTVYDQPHNESSDGYADGQRPHHE